MEFCGILFSNNSRSYITGCYLVAAQPSLCSNHLGASLWMENTTNTNQRKFQTFKIRGFAGGDNSFTGALGRINTFGVALAQDIASGHRTWQWRISHLDPLNSVEFFSSRHIKSPFFLWRISQWENPMFDDTEGSLRIGGPRPILKTSASSARRVSAPVKSVELKLMVMLVGHPNDRENMRKLWSSIVAG